MFKRVALLLTVSLLAVSCSKKSKDDLSEAGITQQDMSFNPMGSDSGAIAGLTTVNFGYDQADLSPEAKATLQANADWIRTNSGVSVQIEGHCDERGSQEYNLALGERRARAVKSYLVSLGVDGNRLQTISYGEERLLASGDMDSAHAQNRRANFVPTR